MVHVEGLRDERLQIDSAGGDEIDGPLVHVGVTKDILNGCLMRLYLRDVDGDRVDWDSYENGPVTGRTDLPQVIVGARMTGALEDDVGSPTRRLLTDDIEQSLILAEEKSEMMTLEAPPASADAAVSRPIVPAPETATTSPGLMRAFVAACMPTARGSMRAPSAKDTLSGRR